MARRGMRVEVLDELPPRQTEDTAGGNGWEESTDYCLTSGGATSCSSFTRPYNAGDTADKVSTTVSVGGNAYIIWRHVRRFQCGRTIEC